MKRVCVILLCIVVCIAFSDSMVSGQELQNEQLAEHSDVYFGSERAPGSISGIVWQDLNADCVRNVTEPGVPDIWVYVDIDESGSIGLGEPAATTLANGTYQISNLDPAVRIIRSIPGPGWIQTFPGSPGFHKIEIKSGENTPMISYGIWPIIDFGDAPESLGYKTLASSGGAFHTVLLGFCMGVYVDKDEDGHPDINALGDDNAGQDDEDGVFFASDMIPGNMADVTVVISNIGYSPGRLQAWIDFNADGDFDDPLEWILQNITLNDGVHDFSFGVPSTALSGTTYARFRYGYGFDVPPNGEVMAGEVEDYKVEIQ